MSPVLVFRLDSDRLWGLALDEVDRVVEVENVETVPRAPSLVAGIAHHHGTILTVVNPRPLLDLPEGDTSVGPVVILRGQSGGGSHLGLRLNRVVRIFVPETEVRQDEDEYPMVEMDSQPVYIVSVPALKSRIAANFGQGTSGSLA